MKKINIIIAAMVLVLSVSCNRKVEFDHETFITIDAATIDVKEDVGTLSIPVTIYNPTGKDVQVTVTVAEGKAKEGVDYDIISPSSGILFFGGDVATQSIEFEIKDDFVGKLTGNKDFSVTIASATPEVPMGGFNKASVTIKDVDHPLDKIFLGEWTGSAVDAFTGMTYPLNVSIVPDEDDDTFTKVLIKNLEPATAPNVLSAAANAEKTKLVIRTGQVIMENVSAIVPGYDEPLYFGGYNMGSQTGLPSQNVEIVEKDGKLKISQYYGAYISAGWLAAFGPEITLTRK